MKNKIIIFLFLIKNILLLILYSIWILLKLLFFYVRIRINSYAFKRSIRKYMDETSASRISRIYSRKIKTVFDFIKDFRKYNF